MVTACILLALILLLLGIETVRLTRQRRALSIRILVLGTRGKTTVTEYLAAALRASGFRTLAKTTGSAPTLTLPDGSRRRVRRRSIARVTEQWRTVHLANRLGCNALVLECMSVAPELQALESHILRPTLSVLTNILEDHQEVYGEDEAWRVRLFTSSLPGKTVLVSGETRHADEVRRAAEYSGSTLIVPTGQEDASGIEPRSGAFELHLRLTPAAAAHLGIAPDAVRTAIRQLPAAVVYKELPISSDGPILRLLNAFAVNDVESASAFLEEWRRHLVNWERTVILLNTRADRPLRSLSFARWCAALRDLETIVLLGSHAPRTRRELQRLGIAPHRIRRWTGGLRVRPIEALRPFATPGTICVGVGNTAGDALRLLDAVGMR